MSLISIVVPLLNEETNANTIYDRCRNVFQKIEQDYEFVIIDDGSTDNTLTVLKDLAETDKKVKILSFSRNFGHQSAITAGIDYAQGDAVVIIDGDLQDPPELIPQMIEKWKEGYQVVYAKRTKRKGETFFKKTTASLFYRTFQYLANAQIPLDTGDFRLMDRSVVDSLKELKERNRFIRGLVYWVGFNQIGVEYERDERKTGESKYPLSKMVRFASNGIFSFSDKPLRLATIMGLLSSMLGLIMIFWGLYSKFVLSDTTIRGWTSVFISILFLGGIQLFTLGIIGEYISRIYDELKARPIYIIQEKINIPTGDNNE